MMFLVIFSLFLFPLCLHKFFLLKLVKLVSHIVIASMYVGLFYFLIYVKYALT